MPLLLFRFTVEPSLNPLPLPLTLGLRVVRTRPLPLPLCVVVLFSTQSPVRPLPCSLDWRRVQEADRLLQRLTVALRFPPRSPRFPRLSPPPRPPLQRPLGCPLLA